MVKWLHVSTVHGINLPNHLFIVVATAMKLFVFSLPFQAGRSAQLIRARVPKYSGSCKGTPPSIWLTISDKSTTESYLSGHNSPFIHTAYIAMHVISIHLTHSFRNAGSARARRQESTILPRSFLFHTGRRSAPVRIWR